MKTPTYLSFALFLVACAPSASDTLSKDEARGLAAKGDAFDYCAEYGWYGDGICDDFCASPDPDCDGACIVTGCSGEICAAEETFSTCDVITPEEACIASGACEPQEDGACGFTMSADVEACLAALQPAFLWMAYAPTQCGTNPWEQDPVANGSSSLPGEVGAVVDYFTAQGIDLLNIGFLESSELLFTCAACSCPRGDRLVVRVSRDDSPALEGFGFMAADDLMGHPTVQCGGNPWQAETDPAALQTEMQMVRSWLVDAGVGLSMFGFVVPVEPVFTCSACSCSRGDVLVAFPIDGSAEGELSGLGFSDLD